MSESKDFLELSFRSIECFSNSGKFDGDELKKLLAIAEKDDIIDQNEIRVLRNVISRIKPEEVDNDMKAMLQIIYDKING